jgi:tripartite-type tricarboxylate transporter receptor subunit TctC
MKRLFLGFFLVLAAGAASAQDYPTRPINIIVPAAAGGPTDTLTRVLAQQMSEALKQQMIVENVGGAGGTIGINRAAKAKPDGYTLLLYHVGMATSPALYRKLQYASCSTTRSTTSITSARSPTCR